ADGQEGTAAERERSRGAAAATGKLEERLRRDVAGCGQFTAKRPDRFHDLLVAGELGRKGRGQLRSRGGLRHVVTGQRRLDRVEAFFPDRVVQLAAGADERALAFGGGLVVVRKKPPQLVDVETEDVTNGRMR